LFQAFPAIRKFNPGLAVQLATENPQLKNATDDMRYVSGGFVAEGGSPEQATLQHAVGLQRSLVTRVKERANCDSSSATQLAQQLTDPSSRVVGFSATVPAIARRNPAEARKLYAAQLQEFAALRSPPDRLYAEVALIGVAAILGDSNQYETMKEDAFELGIQLVKQDIKKNPNERIQNFDSFAELKDLIALAAASDTELSSRIQQLPDDWLKAFLLLYEAEARAKGAEKATVSTICSN
jgi:hypothetical protein